MTPSQSTVALLNCNVHTTVRITAVDICGREGESTNYTLAELLQLPRGGLVTSSSNGPGTSTSDSDKKQISESQYV